MCTGIEIALVAGMAASAVGAVGAASEGQDKKEAAEFSAADQLQLAAREREISKVEEGDFRRVQSRFFADNRAASGGSGVQLNTGSNLLAAQDFAAEVELQAMRIRAGGDTRATRLETQALLTKRAGKAAQTRGFARAGSSLLSGASKAFSVA